MRIAHPALHALVSHMLAAMGSAPEEARIVADHLVEANLKGHPSHGVGMMPSYVRAWRGGKLHPNRHARIVQQHGTMAVFDGQMGFGQVVAREAFRTYLKRQKARPSFLKKRTKKLLSIWHPACHSSEV
jgi:uncharacterized oxidoreductase